MKSIYNKMNLLFVAILLSGLAVSVTVAQEIPSNRDYAFVVIETTVTKTGVETTDSNPQERRFYISNIVEIPVSDKGAYRNAYKTADAYFTKSVVKPMEAKGITHQYYDNNVVVNANKSYVSETRELAEENLKDTLAGLKEQNANVFGFTWTYGKEPNGLETSKPVLISHGKEQPLYGVSEVKAVTPPKLKH